MSLAQLKIFNDWATTMAAETLNEQFQLFNAATNGGLVLKGGKNAGHYSEESFWQRVSGGLVRHRDPAGSGAVTPKSFSQEKLVTVKVSKGTPPVQMDPHDLTYILADPKTYGVLFGQQLAQDRMQDMVLAAAGVYAAAIGQIAALVHDGSAATADFADLLTGASKFGDNADAIKCWLLHSKVAFDIWGTALANNASLFSFGTVNVRTDGFGRPMIISDLSALKVVDGVSAGVDLYRTLGLTPGAVTIEDNGDYFANFSVTNGNENIQATMQAQWTYQAGVKGFAWDVANGGTAPSLSALLTATNWDKKFDSIKDLGGVLVKTR